MPASAQTDLRFEVAALRPVDPQCRVGEVDEAAHDLVRDPAGSRPLAQLVALSKNADRVDHRWLASHEPDVARLLAIDDELQARDSARHRAAKRVQNLDRDPLEGALEHPVHDHDLDPFDLGL